MAPSLKESQALTELADRLYSFLPGKPHPYADQSLFFPGVAAKLGLAQHRTQGSKGPALTKLLTATLESERGRFCQLILAIVQNGMVYRMKKKPVSREEIEELNAIILRVGYKIPELHDPDFPKGLPTQSKRKPAGADAPDPAAICSSPCRL